MDSLIDRLKALSSAEDFFQFFGVPYDERVVKVNRLHILKRFYQYLHRAEGLAGLDDIELFRRYRDLLTQAHEDFINSSAQKEKVFKVFQTADGQQHIAASSLRESLQDLKRSREARAA